MADFGTLQVVVHVSCRTVGETLTLCSWVVSLFTQVGVLVLVLLWVFVIGLEWLAQLPILEVLMQLA